MRVRFGGICGCICVVAVVGICDRGGAFVWLRVWCVRILHHMIIVVIVQPWSWVSVLLPHQCSGTAWRHTPVAHDDPDRHPNRNAFNPLGHRQFCVAGLARDNP